MKNANKKTTNQLVKEIEEKRLETVAEKILTEIESNTTTWRKPWSAEELINFMPCNGVTKHIYTGSNVYLAMMRHESNRYITFKQYQEIKKTHKDFELLKGSKSDQITYTQKLIFKEEAKEEGEEDTIRTCILKKYYNVFNLSCFAHIPEFLTKKAEKVEKTVVRNNKLVSLIVKRAGAVINNKYQNQAYYMPSTHEIYLPEKRQFKDSISYYSTLLHELAHWTGKKLNRDMSGIFGSMDYAKEELIADLSSFFMCSILGIGYSPKALKDRTNKNRSYLKSWLEKCSKKQSRKEHLIDVLKQVDRVIKYLTGFVKDELFKDDPIVITEGEKKEAIKPVEEKKPIKKAVATVKKAVKKAVTKVKEEAKNLIYKGVEIVQLQDSFKDNNVLYKQIDDLLIEGNEIKSVTASGPTILMISC